MTHPLFTFVAPSRGGKSSIIKGVLARLPNKVEIVRSITTRTPRGPDHPRYEPDDELFYRYVTRQEVAEMRENGRILQLTEYADNIYGNDRIDVDSVLTRVCGINAMVEESVLKFRAAGYDVRVINIVPKNAKDERTEKRRSEDDARAARPSALVPNFTVMNDFGHKDGLEKAIDQVVMWMAPQLAPAKKW